MKEVYTSAEARAALRVDAKTFLRWLAQADMHPAVSKKDHRVKVFTAEQIERLAYDHERVLTSNVASENTLSTEDRLSALERRMNDLEAILKNLSTYTPVKRLAPLRPSYAQNEALQSDTLPENYTLIYDLLKEHGLTSQRQSIIKQMERRGLLKKGSWKYQGHAVNNALDAVGVDEFLRLYVEE